MSLEAFRAKQQIENLIVFLHTNVIIYMCVQGHNIVYRGQIKIQFAQISRDRYVYFYS